MWRWGTFRALDAPTGWLLLAFLAARSPRPTSKQLAYALTGVGLTLAVAEFPFHRAMVDNEHILRALPLYYGLGVGAYVLAAGRTWERWLSLALMSRAFYWSTAGTIDVARSGLGDVAHLFVNRIGLLALGIAAIAAVVRLMRTDDRPPASVVIPALIIGPAAALIETGASLALPPDDVFRYGSLVFANLLTLGLVRPILTLAGVAPTTLVPALGRVALATGVATVATLGMAPFDFGDAPLTDAAVAYAFGACIGLIAVAALEAAPNFRLHRAGPPVTEPAHPPGAPPQELAEHPSEAPTRGPPAEPASLSAATTAFPIPTSRPQWQTVLIEIKGSHLPEGASAAGEYRLTQRAIVERTGVRASRVSTLVRELNESATTRLDSYSPGWREGPHGRGTADLIRQYRGAVAGVPGIWVYYRLTPLGEALAEALESAEFRENSAAP